MILCMYIKELAIQELRGPNCVWTRSSTRRCPNRRHTPGEMNHNVGLGPACLSQKRAFPYENVPLSRTALATAPGSVIEFSDFLHSLAIPQDAVLSAIDPQSSVSSITT